jgi:hypothetical protein
MFTLNSGKLKRYLPRLMIFIIILSLFSFAFPQEAEAWAPWELIWSPGVELGKGLLTLVSDVILWAAGLFLMMTGFLMNLTIKITIEQMSDFVKNEGVRAAWTVIRDVANIGFIFGIVYIAISTILRVGGQTAKELLGKLIMMAILINFSFFFTGVIIDTSNILTLTLYEEIKKINNDYSVTLEDEEEDSRNLGEIIEGEGGMDFLTVGISGAFMQELRLTSFFKGVSEDIGGTEGETETPDYKSIVILSIFAVIMIGILGFIFLVVSLLLLIRLIALVILMVLSPIAYLGWALPATKGYSDKWWTALWNQVLFAPAYMLMTLVVLVIISNEKWKEAMAKGNASGGGFESLLTDFADIAYLVVNYIVIVGLVIASVVIAVQTSEKSGGVIAAAAKKTKGWVAGGLSRTGRQTLGRAGSFVAGNKWLKKKQRSGGKWGRAAGLALRAGEKTEGGSFDIRGAYGGEYLGAGKAPKDRDRRSVRKKWAKKRAERVMKRGTLTDEEMAKPEVKERWEASPEYEEAMKKTKELEKQYENATQAEKYDVAEEQEEEKEKLEDKMRVQMEKFKKNDPRRQYGKEIYALPGEKGYGTTGWNMGRVKRFLAKKSKRFLFTDRKRRDARRETDKLVNRTTEDSQIYDAVRDATADSQAGSS